MSSEAAFCVTNGDVEQLESVSLEAESIDDEEALSCVWRSSVNGKWGVHGTRKRTEFREGASLSRPIQGSQVGGPQRCRPFHEILYTLERFGYLLRGKEGDISKYKEVVRAEAENSALAVDIPGKHREWHTPFSNLYELVRFGRNDALHQGAFARNLTIHATQLALVLEDALTDKATTIGDFMVRGPICALPWQPISFVRQQMLANSFSHLPMQWEAEQGTAWKLVSDFHVARYLRLSGNVSGSERKGRLAKTVKDAAGEGLLALEDATRCSSDTTVEDALPLFSDDSRPLLVHHPDDPGMLMGIVTAYDLL